MSDTSAIIIAALKDGSKMPPILGIRDAARTAVAIAGAAQGARNNKEGFKHLREESCQIVYEVIRRHEKGSRAEEVPTGVVDNVQLLVHTLKSIEEFVHKAASRNIVKVLLHSVVQVDARKIKSYQEELERCSRELKFQFKSSLQDTVAVLAANQLEMGEGLNATGECYGINTTAPVIEDVNSPFNPDEGKVEITAMHGDLISGQVVETTRNINSCNVMTNATVNCGNKTTVVTNTFSRNR